MRASIVVAVLGVCLFSNQAAAQDVGVGVKGGLHRSSLSIEGLPQLSAEADWGGTFGAFVDIGTDRRISFRPEIQVTWYHFTLSEGTEVVESGTRSIDLPLLVAARFGNSPRIKGFVVAGPQISFINDAWQQFRGERVDFDDELEDVDGAIVFGGGIELPVERGAFLIEGRVTFGLRDVFKEEAVSVKASALGIHFGYRF
jgi:hypothetical protein